MNELNDDNFLIFAIKHYRNSSCTGMAELEDDLKRFKYLKRLFNRYEKTGDPNDRLIINHLTLLYNVFGNATTEMLFFKLEEKYWINLKTYLVFLNRLPLEEVYSRTLLPKKIITDIPLNNELIKILRNI
jgi:hypothetical protein|tara:strand:- start:528 stop:917 length:390 start_codon:yes stop_codon:yes gene_type:complete